MSRFIYYFNIHILAPEKERWMKLHDDSSSVCFGLQNNNYGVIKIKQQMETMYFKLVHRSGTMGYGTHPDNFWDGSSDNELAIYITNKFDQVIAPGGITNLRNNYNYAYLPDEDEVILSKLTPVYLRRNEELRLWFSQDLSGSGQSVNNVICADVYGWGKLFM